MYDDILIPTDGSDVAETAVDHAIDLAETYDATVHTLYVVDVDALDVSLGTEQVQRIKQGQFEEMNELRTVAVEATGDVVDRGEARGLEVLEEGRRRPGSASLPAGIAGRFKRSTEQPRHSTPTPDDPPHSG